MKSSRGASGWEDSVTQKVDLKSFGVEQGQPGLATIPEDRQVGFLEADTQVSPAPDRPEGSCTETTAVSGPPPAMEPTHRPRRILRRRAATVKPWQQSSLKAVRPEGLSPPAPVSAPPGRPEDRVNRLKLLLRQHRGDFEVASRGNSAAPKPKPKPKPEPETPQKPPAPRPGASMGGKARRATPGTSTPAQRVEAPAQRVEAPAQRVEAPAQETARSRPSPAPARSRPDPEHRPWLRRLEASPLAPPLARAPLWLDPVTEPRAPQFPSGSREDTEPRLISMPTPPPLMDSEPRPRSVPTPRPVVTVEHLPPQEHQPRPEVAPEPVPVQAPDSLANTEPRLRAVLTPPAGLDTLPDLAPVVDHAFRLDAPAGDEELIPIHLETPEALHHPAAQAEPPEYLPVELDAPRPLFGPAPVADLRGAPSGPAPHPLNFAARPAEDGDGVPWPQLAPGRLRAAPPTVRVQPLVFGDSDLFLAPRTSRRRRQAVMATVLGLLGTLAVLAAVFFIVVPTAPRGGAIEVRSVPAGATVKLDGVPVAGVTPLTIRVDDPTREYEVQLSLEGHVVWRDEVRLSWAEPRVGLVATLAPKKAAPAEAP